MRTTHRAKFQSNNREMRETKQNFMKVAKNNSVHQDTNTDFHKVPNINHNKNLNLEPINKKQTPNNNVFVINRKEAKKFEDILKNTHNMNFELATSNNFHTNNVNNQIKPINNKRASKIILDPINSNPFNKKIEVSFKATMQFTDDLGMNNKIEISPNINLNNQNIVNNVNQNRKSRLEKIPESKLRLENESPDDFIE